VRTLLLLTAMLAFASDRSLPRSAPRSAGGHTSRYRPTCERTPSVRIKRDSAARTAFRRRHPCPSTGNGTGACPGYVIDHIKALKRGGPDAPSNMQWQTAAAARAKDRVEWSASPDRNPVKTNHASPAQSSILGIIVRSMSGCGFSVRGRPRTPCVRLRMLRMAGMMFFPSFTLNATLQVATRDGIVVCADKRQSIDEVIVRDNATKVLAASNMLVWATGTTGFTNRQTHAVRSDIFEFLRRFFAEPRPTLVSQVELPLHEFLSARYTEYITSLTSSELPPPSVAQVFVLGMTAGKPQVAGIQAAYKAAHASKHSGSRLTRTSSPMQRSWRTGLMRSSRNSATAPTIDLTICAETLPFDAGFNNHLRLAGSVL
jgi:hypothetical protein